MSDFRQTLNEVFDFAKRYGLDPQELVLMITKENKPTSSNTVMLGGVEATAAAMDVVVEAKRNGVIDITIPEQFTSIVNPQALAADNFHKSRLWWLGRDIGFAATAREIYEGAGLNFPRRSRRLTEWLMKSGTSRHSGYANGTMVFERI